MAAALPLAALIPQNQTLTVIRPDATLKHALEVLYGARITAVPVVDNKKVIGMLDVLDIVAFLAQLNKKNSKTQNSKDLLQSSTEEFNATKVQAVLDLSGKSPLVQLPGTASQDKLLELFAMGIHRVVVLNELDEIQGVISQMDLLTKQTEYAAGSLGDSLRKSIGSLGFLKHVLSVDKNESALTAFNQMHDQKVSALAVTDNGRLIDNLSASDVRRVEALQKSITLLSRPVSAFIDNTPKGEKHLAHLRRRPLISVDQNETLQQVLHKISEHHVHRVYIVDGAGHPIGVVTLTNILALARAK